VENGICVEELNLRSAVRSTPNQASGRPRQTYSIDIADVAWAKGDCGNYVAAATSSGKIILYDLGHAGLQSAQLHEHFRQVHKVTFNPHRGSLLLSGSQDGTVRLWDVRDARSQASSLQSKRKYSGQSDGVRDVKWSPTEGVDFAIATESGFIQRWDMRNLKAAKVKIPAHALSCNIIDWHPDGKHIASASSDKTVRVWDFSASRKGKSAWEIKTPYPVLNARWRPACESSMPTDNGARQCTQLVTA
ncbi:SEA (Seh1-associated) complex subunit, partial [Teratosphaeriaceae sp. CCFEE 6253]